MEDPQSIVLDLMAGRWRTQAIYAGAKLGIFDAVGLEPRRAAAVAAELGLDAAMTYRLMRALGSIGLLTEGEEQSFRATDAGAYLRGDHPQSVRDAVLLREGPEHTSVWKHLPAIVRDGIQDGFVREYGRSAFEHAAGNPAYAEAFDAGMSSYSRMQTAWTIEVLGRRDIGAISHLCDIGGGQGHLLCHFLARYPHLRGTVLERPSVIEDAETLWAGKLGVGDRCRYIGGDMFVDVPRADAYIMKMILHDWNDAECVRILRNVHERAPAAGRLFVVEHVIPGRQTPHFAKLFDLHMMTWGTGRERSEEEYAALLSESGWKYAGARHPEHGDIGVVEGVKV